MKIFFKQSVLMFIIAFLLFFFNLPQLVAQPPRLDFRRIDATAFPKVTAYISVKCNGQFQNNVTAKNITIKEDGELIKNVTLICPPELLCCQSVALVIDRSGSMAGQPMEQLKEAARLYVSLLDTTCDQAAVVSFGSNVTVDAFMTPDTSLLNVGINNISAGGATALWDGVGTGVTEVVNNGKQDCRAVIVVTDGGENSSTKYSLDDCISLAQTSGIRVFTVGLGQGVVEPPLQILARETGGIYYHAPSGDQLKAIFREIYSVVSQRFQECSFTYTSSCPDGATHTVEISVGTPLPLSGCPGTDTKVKIYKAPFDSTAFTSVNISLDNIISTGPGTVSIPVRAMDSVKASLTPATFRVLFDSTCLTWSDFSTQGGQWDGVPAIVTPVPGGVEVRIPQKKTVPGKGILGTMTFQTVDTTISCRTCEVRLENWDLESGCITPVLNNGTVMAGQPALSLLDPLPGTGICSGKDYVVRWQESCVDSVTILLSDNGGSSWKVLAEHVPAGKGEWTWMVSEQAGTRYRLRIFNSSDNTLVDETPADFFI
ncbi:MAG: VWA domain-containing protein, partial [Chlorobi bacterium]|nr:VWA domain-containing protein [Chlorobiota bacterium]